MIPRSVDELAKFQDVYVQRPLYLSKIRIHHQPPRYATDTHTLR